MTSAICSYVDWLIETALPFWAEHGFDQRSARFHERLSLDGSPLNVAHRAMVQARQIYVFAHAAELGWYSDGDALAALATERLLRDFAEGEAAFVFSIDPRTGATISGVHDTYTYAFLLLALSWRYRRTRDIALIEQVDRLLTFLDVNLLDPIHGGLYDAVPTIDRAKRQNPLMHLLEAFLSLEEIAPGRGYLTRGKTIVELFVQHLFRADHGVLLEHFAEDWGPHPNPVRASAWEPGHHFEWVWLLDRYTRLAGLPLEPAASILFAKAQTHGLAHGGLIYDEMGLGLGPTKRSHRLWPHTEAIKAGLVRDDLAMAERAAATLIEHFCARPFAGGWIDHIDADGRSLVDSVPASSLYHLFLAGAEAAAAFGLRPGR